MSAGGGLASTVLHVIVSELEAIGARAFLRQWRVIDVATTGARAFHGQWRVIDVATTCGDDVAMTRQ